MEIFAPIQLDQVQKRLATFQNSCQAHYEAKVQSNPRYPTELTFKGIALLNLPAFLKFSRIQLLSHIEAVRRWKRWSTTSLLGRWTAPTLEHWGWRDPWINFHSRVLGAKETVDWTRRLGLSSKSPIWTWVTSGFVHQNADHFFSNMLGLYLYTPICSKIPGMSPSHVCVITLGSSIFVSVAQLLEWYLRPSFSKAIENHRVAIGASGIISAFAAMAGVAMPWENVSFFGISIPCSYMVGLQFIKDLAGLLQVDLGQQNKTGRQVGYAMHLGGALFGVLYYFLVLNRRGRFTGEGHRLDGGDELPGTLGASQEGHL